MDYRPQELKFFRHADSCTLNNKTTRIFGISSPTGPSNGLAGSRRRIQTLSCSRSLHRAFGAPFAARLPSALLPTLALITGTPNIRATLTILVRTSFILLRGTTFFRTQQTRRIRPIITSLRPNLHLHLSDLPTRHRLQSVLYDYQHLTSEIELVISQTSLLDFPNHQHTFLCLSRSSTPHRAASR